MEKSGKIKALGKEKLQEYVDLSNSYADLLKEIGLKPYGRNYVTLNKYLKEWDIDLTGINERRKTTFASNKKYDDETFRKVITDGNCTLKGHKILARLVKSGMREYKCEECGISDWNNKPLVLQLHHIDGDTEHNSIDNIKILCPNCHSQTDNFRRYGGNKKKA